MLSAIPVHPYPVHADRRGVLASLACALAVIVMLVLRRSSYALAYFTGARAAVLFAVWCASLLLCVHFPVDNSPRIETVHGLVHRLAGGYLVARLPALVPWLGFPLDARGISGLIQRMLFALETGLVGVLGWRLLRVGWHARGEVAA